VGPGVALRSWDLKSPPSSTASFPGTFSIPVPVDDFGRFIESYGKAQNKALPAEVQNVLANLAPPTFWIPFVTNVIDASGLLNAIDPLKSLERYYRVHELN
jgi:hypothetical protein